eukprot:15449419-Alexandrium_andersonii.AAC.1
MHGTAWFSGRFKQTKANGQRRHELLRATASNFEQSLRLLSEGYRHPGRPQQAPPTRIGGACVCARVKGD